MNSGKQRSGFAFLKQARLVAGIFLVAHMIGMVLLFVSIEMSSDGEAVMGWHLFSIIDWPVSLLGDVIHEQIWRSEILWYDENSFFAVFSGTLGFDRLNVGEFALFTAVGVFQAIMIGVLVASVRVLWRKVAWSKRGQENNR